MWHRDAKRANSVGKIIPAQCRVATTFSMQSTGKQSAIKQDSHVTVFWMLRSTSTKSPTDTMWHNLELFVLKLFANDTILYLGDETLEHDRDS